MARDLEKERLAIGEFGKKTGRQPESSEDWTQVHNFAYGANLPDELKQLPINQNTQNTTNTPQTPPADDTGVNFRGADVGDAALGRARAEVDSYDQGNFLNKVKSRMQQKFKPENEQLGLSSYAKSLGPLDPSGVMKGMNDQTGQFKRKGKLMLSALANANNVYSSQASLAADRLDRLEQGRTMYEQEQKAFETEMKGLALGMIKEGMQPPEDLIKLLPPQLQETYRGAADLFKEEDGIGGFSPTQKLQLEQAGLLGAPRQEQLDFFYKGDEGGVSSEDFAAEAEMWIQSFMEKGVSRTDLSSFGFSENQVRAIVAEAMKRGEFSEEELKFKEDVEEYIKKLAGDDISWADAFDAIKTIYPDVPNKVLDAMLNKEKFYER